MSCTYICMYVCMYVCMATLYVHAKGGRISASSALGDDPILSAWEDLPIHRSFNPSPYLLVFLAVDALYLSLWIIVLVGNWFYAYMVWYPSAHVSLRLLNFVDSFISHSDLDHQPLCDPFLYPCVPCVRNELWWVVTCQQSHKYNIRW